MFKFDIILIKMKSIEKSDSCNSDLIGNLFLLLF